jgi:hypothetical protein
MRRFCTVHSNRLQGVVELPKHLEDGFKIQYVVVVALSQ